MADVLSSVVTAQTIAGLKRENTQLHRTLADVRSENHSLKRQLFHSSAILDLAMSKLSSLGVSLDPPVDLRALRSEVKAMMPWSSEGTAGGAVSLDAMETQRKAADGPNEASTMQRKFRLQAEIKDHARSVQCAAFGPEDQHPWIASGGLDKKVVVSNFLSGAKHAVMDYHEQNVSDVVWLSGATILSASFDCTVKTCDLAAGQFKTPLFTAQTRAFALAACAVADWTMSTTVFAACDSKQWLYVGDTRVAATRSLPTQWLSPTRANTIAYDPSVKCLITGHINGTVALWDIRKLRTAVTTLAPTQPNSESGTPFPSGAAVSSDGSPVGDVAASMDGIVGGPKSPSRPSATIEAAPVPNANSIGPTAPSFEWVNEPSRSPITHASFYGDRDSSKKLFVVSEDNMARLYGRQGAGIGIDQESSPAAQDLHLEGVLSGFQTRSYSVRGAFWCGTGQREKRAGASIFDDVEREAESRHVSECDLVVCGGGEDCGLVFDVTDASTGVSPVLLQRLDGHRGRVWGACVHRNSTKPIIATFGEDSCVRVWVPRK